MVDGISKEYTATGVLKSNIIKEADKNNSSDNTTAAAGSVVELASDSFTSSNSTSVISQLESKIEELKQKKATNLQEIEQLKLEIPQLEKQAEAKKKEAEHKETEAENKASQALKKQKDAGIKQEQEEEAYKNKSEKAAEAEIEKYKKSNENGEEMSKSTLSLNIAEAVSQVPEFSNVKSDLNQASSLQDSAVNLNSEASNLRAEESSIRSDIESKKIRITTLTNENSQLDGEIDTLEESLAAARRQQQAQSGSSSGGTTGSGGNGGSSGGGSSSSGGSSGSSGSSGGGSSSGGGGGSAEPIGFHYNNKTYDFIIDDGKFDSVEDFLGFRTMWSEMQALNKDGNDIVDINELKEANIKMVDDRGTVHNIDELFGNDFYVNLKSYDENGDYNIDRNDDDNDGIPNQVLLGTYNVNINGKAVNGYNTFDDTEWLINKFHISGENPKAEKNLTAEKVNKDVKNNKTENTNPASNIDLSEFNNTSVQSSTYSEKLLNLNINNSEFENAKNKLAKFRNSLINNPLSMTEEREAKQSAEDKKEEDKKALLK